MNHDTFMTHSCTAGRQTGSHLALAKEGQPRQLGTLCVVQGVLGVSMCFYVFLIFSYICIIIYIYTFLPHLGIGMLVCWTLCTLRMVRNLMNLTRAPVSSVNAFSILFQVEVIPFTKGARPVHHSLFIFFQIYFFFIFPISFLVFRLYLYGVPKFGPMFQA